MPLEGEPDLDAPGKPLKARIVHDDGSWSPHLIEQSKRENYADLATVCGGADKVTPEAVEAAGTGTNGSSSCWSCTTTSATYASGSPLT